MKKMEHIWSLICSNSTTDQQTNNISLFNLVEKFSFTIKGEDSKKIKKNQKIVIPFKQELITRFMRKLRSVDIIFEMRLDFVSPSGNITKGKQTTTVTFPKKFSNMRVRNLIDNLPVEESGLYHFSINVREVGETDFVEMGIVTVEININIEK